MNTNQEKKDIKLNENGELSYTQNYDTGEKIVKLKVIEYEERNGITINDKFSYTLCYDNGERQYILKVIEIKPKSYILQEDEIIDTPELKELDYNEINNRIKNSEYNRETAFYNKEYDGLYIRGICGGDYKDKTYLQYYY